jgi:hypothetical protein
MRDWQHQHVVYAPDPWLVGQAGGRSDIRGAEKPVEWWLGRDKLPPGPVALAKVSRDVLEAMITLGFHPGASRDEDGIDEGLKRVFATPSRAERVQRLKDWLTMIQVECVGGLLPTVWHADATLDLVQEAWAGQVYLVQGNTAYEAFACLPVEIQQRMRDRQSIRISPIILLHCPTSMVEHLHPNGFHPGYWRNRETGIDKGLERIFAEVPEERRIDELRRWCEFLCREGDRDGLIVTARHPQLTAAMLKAATPRPVLEIKADNIEELKAALLCPR